MFCKRRAAFSILFILISTEMIRSCMGQGQNSSVETKNEAKTSTVSAPTGQVQETKPEINPTTPMAPPDGLADSPIMKNLLSSLSSMRGLQNSPIQLLDAGILSDNLPQVMEIAMDFIQLVNKAQNLFDPPQRSADPEQEKNDSKEN